MQNMEEITLVKDAINNPDDPRHFARIKNIGHPVIALVDETEIARSEKARKVLEVGQDIYEPVLYFPRVDVRMELLVESEKTTHCPLKGDTEYFDIVINEHRINDAAWSYIQTFDRSIDIKEYIAFDLSKVQVIEYTVK